MAKGTRLLLEVCAARALPALTHIWCFRSVPQHQALHTSMGQDSWKGITEHDVQKYTDSAAT